MTPIEHYEAALMAAFPEGASGKVFEHWNAARIAQAAPSIPEISDDLIEAIESRAEQSYRRHHGSIRGQQLTPADALSWHIIHATRDVLAAAPEAKS